MGTADGAPPTGLPPRLLLQLRAERLLARGGLGRQDVRGEVGGLEDLAYLDDLPVREGNARGPFQRLRPRRHLDHPEAGQQLLRLREGPIGHETLAAGVRDASALRARVE